MDNASKDGTKGQKQKGAFLNRLGKLSRYTIYAFGEVFLIVIGILLALQIDNWKSKKLAAIEEQKLLQNLRTEFQENLQDLDTREETVTNTANALNVIFEMFGKTNTTLSERQIDSILSIGLSSRKWDPSEFVLNDLQSSGRLTKLNNQELKKLLFDWSTFYTNLLEIHLKILQSNDDLINYIKDNGSLRNVDRFSTYLPSQPTLLGEGNLQLLEDPVFENYIGDKLFNLNHAKSEYQNARILISKILNTSNKTDN